MAKLQVPVTAADHSKGDPDARITLVEYGDYQCPDAGFAYTVVKELQKKFGKNLRLVYRNFPLVRIHPMAEPAAEAAEFAAARGKFWEMHDALFENQEDLSGPVLAELAEDLGLEPEAAVAAIENQEYLQRIEKDVEGGKRSGVHGTPTFFINGVLHQGAYEFEDLAAAIKAAA